MDTASTTQTSLWVAAQLMLQVFLFTDEAIATALDSDAVLMGSIGGNTATSPWYKLAPELRPEAGLLKLRKSLNLFANLRPAYLYKELAAACPLSS